MLLVLTMALGNPTSSKELFCNCLITHIYIYQSISTSLYLEKNKKPVIHMRIKSIIKREKVMIFH